MLLIIALFATCPPPFQRLADTSCGCRRAPRTVLYDGRCLAAADLTKAYRCPTGSAAEADDNTMFWERACKGPDGQRVGPATTWIVARDSLGYPMRQITLDASGAGEFLFFHANTDTVTQRHEMKGGKLHGVQRVFRPDGSLQERFHREVGQLHGLSTEYAADGKTPKILRCMQRSALVWKQDAAPLDVDKPCPPKGFDPAQMPNATVRVWLKLDVGLLDSPYGLAALPDGSLLFTRNAKDAKLWRIRAPGAKPEPVANFEEERPGAVVVAPPTKAASQRAFVVGQSGVWAVDLKSGKAERQIELALGNRRQTAAWGGGALFWHEPRAEWTDAPADPGQVRRLYGGAVQAIEMDARPVAVTVAGAHVWWADERGPVRRAPLKGGPVELVHDADEELYGLAVHRGEVYLSGARGVARAGGKTLASKARTHRLLVDEAHVFWVDGDGLFRVPKGGGPDHALTTNTNTPRTLVWRRLANQPAELCWTDIVRGTIACVDHRARERRFNEPL